MDELYVPNNCIDKRLKKRIWIYVCRSYTRFIILFILLLACFICFLLKGYLICRISMFVLCSCCICEIVNWKLIARETLKLLKKILKSDELQYDIHFTDNHVDIDSTSSKGRFALQYKDIHKIKRIDKYYLFVTKSSLFFVCDTSTLNNDETRQLENIIKKINDKRV